ncbi:hypothetical protein ACUWC3_28820, partial [Klebsiella pneumoniae]|uniref:hypothetical protein n=1 Tax=Klebsiella pneumoniae TaxID=573 RepID=UPI0040558760
AIVATPVANSFVPVLDSETAGPSGLAWGNSEVTSPANAVKPPPIAITGENVSTSGVSSLLGAQGIQEFSLR